jgi:hypothetical protein
MNKIGKNVSIDLKKKLRLFRNDDSIHVTGKINLEILFVVVINLRENLNRLIWI